MSSITMIPREACHLVNPMGEPSLSQGGDQKVVTGIRHGTRKAKSAIHDTRNVKDSDPDSVMRDELGVTFDLGSCNGRNDSSSSPGIPPACDRETQPNWTENDVASGSPGRATGRSNDPHRSGATRRSREAIGEALEREHVHNVYRQMSHHFQDVRFKAWPKVRQFLHDLEPGSVVADIGCGNGKYLHINKEIVKLGSDQCLPLVEIARGHNHETMVADNLKLPYRDNCFDAVISIAVIHHFTTARRRAHAIQELARILRPGGRLMVYVWAMEQKHRKFKAQDVLVPWHFKTKHPKREKQKSTGDNPQAKSPTTGEPTETLVAKTSKSKQGKSDTASASSHPSSKDSSSNGHKRETSIPHIIKSHLLRLLGSKDSVSESEKLGTVVEGEKATDHSVHRSIEDVVSEQEVLYKVPRPVLEHSLSASEIEGFAVREFPMSSRPPVHKQVSLDLNLSCDHRACDQRLCDYRSCDHQSCDHRSCDQQSSDSILDCSSYSHACRTHNFNMEKDQNHIRKSSLSSLVDSDSRGGGCAKVLPQTADYSMSPNNNNSDDESRGRSIDDEGHARCIEEEGRARCIDQPRRPYHKHCGSPHCSKSATCPSSPTASHSGKHTLRRLNSQSPQRAPKSGFGVVSDSENDDDWMRNTRRAIQTMQSQVDSRGQPLPCHNVTKCCSFHEHRPQVLLPTDIAKLGDLALAKDCPKFPEHTELKFKDVSKVTKHSKIRDFFKMADLFKGSDSTCEAKVVNNSRSGMKYRKRMGSDNTSMSSVSSVSSLSSMSSDTDTSDVEELGSVCSLCGNVPSNMVLETGQNGSLDGTIEASRNGSLDRNMIMEADHNGSLEEGSSGDSHLSNTTPSIPMDTQLYTTPSIQSESPLESEKTAHNTALSTRSNADAQDSHLDFPIPEGADSHSHSSLSGAGTTNTPFSQLNQDNMEGVKQKDSESEGIKPEGVISEGANNQDTTCMSKTNEGGEIHYGIAESVKGESTKSGSVLSEGLSPEGVNECVNPESVTSDSVNAEGVNAEGVDKDSAKRFYHVFREEELVDLITKNVDSLHVLDSYYDHANWCVVCEKVNVWTL